MVVERSITEVTDQSRVSMFGGFFWGKPLFLPQHRPTDVKPYPKPPHLPQPRQPIMPQPARCQSLVKRCPIYPKLARKFRQP